MTARRLLSGECRLGYTWRQVETLVGPRLPEFEEWMGGQTVSICDGGPPCSEPHGTIVYSDDVTRFLAGGRIVD